jgi:hypothetical protein
MWGAFAANGKADLPCGDTVKERFAWATAVRKSALSSRQIGLPI